MLLQSLELPITFDLQLKLVFNIVINGVRCGHAEIIMCLLLIE